MKKIITICMLSAFSAHGMQKAVSLEAQKLKKLANTQRTLATLHEINNKFGLNHVAIKLKIIKSQPGISVACTTLEESEQSNKYTICIESEKFYSYTPDEQRFILAHEMAHIHYEHTPEMLAYNQRCIVDIHAKLKETETESHTQEYRDLERIYNNNIRDYYRKYRKFEVDADILAAETFDLRAAGISFLKRAIVESGVTQKAHPYLTHYASLYETVPCPFDRIRHLTRLPKRIKILTRKDDFTAPQRKLIRILYQSKIDYPDADYLRIAGNAEEVFDSLPSEVRKQLLSDISLKFSLEESGEAIPAGLSLQATPEETIRLRLSGASTSASFDGQEADGQEAAAASKTEKLESKAS